MGLMASHSPSYPALMQRVLSEALSEYNDRQLLERFIQSGDEAAFALLLDRHGPMLLGLCRRLLKDTHLADDVVQATFLVLVRKAGSIRRRDSLADWLYGVAVRLARQVRLSEAARSRREQQAAKQHGEASASDPGWEELLRILDEELQRLPERQRSPLLLCYLEGCTQDEAAKQLGWSLSTLRRRLEKGRELLRARMLRRGATLGAGLFAGFLAPSALRAALPMEWRHAVLTAVKTGGKGVAVSASVLVLVEGGLRMATGVKILSWSIVAVMVGGLLAGVAWETASAMRAEERPGPSLPPQQEIRKAEAPLPEPAKEAKAERDLFNNPLPNGAVARLGTLAFRHGRVLQDGSLTFTPNGKYLVSAGGGWVRRWDLVTGSATINIGDGGRQSGRVLSRLPALQETFIIP
jgi:RNA polymerase sigma factor (sigma-70 family)